MKIPFQLITEKSGFSANAGARAANAGERTLLQVNPAAF